MNNLKNQRCQQFKYEGSIVKEVQLGRQHFALILSTVLTWK
jgi:hypothetical protein